MFALELADPVTRRLVPAEMTVKAEGFGPPLQSPSGRYVWLDVDPPAARQIKLKAVSRNGAYGSLAAEFQVPAHVPDTPAPDLVRRFNLTPTGLYDPPAGMTAAAGMLIADADARTPLAEVKVRVGLRRHSDSSLLASDYEALTDGRGGFVAMVPDLGDERPLATPAPAPEGGIVGWLRFEDPDGSVRFSELLPLRNGRLLRIAAPLAWPDLRTNIPPAPP